MVNESIQKELEHRRRRRNIEYIALISIHGFFTGAFLDSLLPIPTLGAMLSAGGLAWTLSQLREKRRTLPSGSSYRVIADVIEMLLLLLFVMIAYIVALKQGDESLFVYQAHFSLVMMSYFTFTCFGETAWVRKVFSMLDSAEQLNYLTNLNPSLIFPYNLKSIQRALGFGKNKTDA